jgi:lambda repressor-like predicted transcriptional regulator
MSRRLDRAALDAALAARGITPEQLLGLAGIRRELWGIALVSPGPLQRSAIARVLGVSVDELWPLALHIEEKIT